MTIDYNAPGKVIFRMDDYVSGMLDESRDDMSMKGVSPDPANDELFTVNDNSPPLNQDDGDCFHTMVTKLLFLSERARPDIQQAVAFLTTRISKSTEEDYKKLGRIIRYLRGEPSLPLTLQCNNVHVIKWWIDASVGVHQDLKSQTGATVLMGKGSACSASKRQKLNTRSSTEAEVVAVADVMPMILWTRQFLIAQGYNVERTDLFQDNKSAMLIETNGQTSSGKRTRHLNLQHFFIADRVKAVEVSIHHCPTDEMTADFFTEPLCGAKFIKFRALMLNLSDDDGPMSNSIGPQECVNHECPGAMHHLPCLLYTSPSPRD